MITNREYSVLIWYYYWKLSDYYYKTNQIEKAINFASLSVITSVQKINEIINSKKELTNMAIFEGERIITELSDEEIYEIFSLSAG